MSWTHFLGIDDSLSLVEYLIRTYGSNAKSTTIHNIRNAYSDYLDGLPDCKDVFVMTHSDLHPNNVVMDRAELKARAVS